MNKNEIPCQFELAITTIANLNDVIIKLSDSILKLSGKTYNNNIEWP